ncbi:MAG: hypothetical protein JKY44_03915 [Flavobacteriaceae bacterium]|nr:hypothetical protein [Flavobacteriaceae bacterium]
MNKSILKTIEWILRIGIFLCFLGHGVIALGENTAWIPYLELLGLKGNVALDVMFIIGIVDVLVAFVILIKPIKIIVFWACFWTLITALVRPISGESIWTFVERGPNWITPILLYLVLYKIQKKLID